MRELPGVAGEQRLPRKNETEEFVQNGDFLGSHQFDFFGMH